MYKALFRMQHLHKRSGCLFFLFLILSLLSSLLILVYLAFGEQFSKFDLKSRNFDSSQCSKFLDGQTLYPDLDFTRKFQKFKNVTIYNKSDYKKAIDGDLITIDSFNNSKLIASMYTTKDSLEKSELITCFLSHANNFLNNRQDMTTNMTILLVIWFLIFYILVLFPRLL